MTLKETSLLPTIDIEDLGLDAGAHLLIKHGLLGVPPGGDIGVIGRSRGWEAQLAAWCRSQGHPMVLNEQDGRVLARVTRGGFEAGRWRNALHTGHVDATQPGDMVVCLGAGDITKWAGGLADKIKFLRAGG